jgi:drug/metabolite transporter (DMT)-like permease
VQRISPGPYLWMLLGCASFTVMYALVHVLRNACDWQIIALVRTGLACLFALGLATAAGAELVLWRPHSLWVRSIAGSISLLCSFFAMTRDVPVSTVLAITYTFPLWVALLAWPLLGLRPGWPILLSVFTAVAGVFLIRAPAVDGAAFFLDLDNDASLASLLALVASIATAVAMLGLNQLHWIDSRAVVAHFSGVSMIFCFGALAGFEKHVSLNALFDPQVLLGLLALGIAATAGQICLTKAFTIGAPAKVAVVSLVQVVMTLLVDIAILGEGERLSMSSLCGMALILLPTAWLVSRRKK